MTQVIRSFAAMAVFILLLGFGYTLAVTGVANLIWPNQASGSLIERDGAIIGSELLAQPFEDVGYFWPRPSASGYNSDSELDVNARSLSYPSNLGPTNPDLTAAIADGVAVHGEGVPVDLVTGSGSALDPHISVAAAHWQVGRIAQARGLDEGEVMALIDQHVESWIGRRYVNVLMLNLALDQISG